MECDPYQITYDIFHRTRTNNAKIYVGVQSLSCDWLSVTSWTAALQTSLSFIISPSLLKLMFIELVLPSNHLILCCPLLLLPSIFPSIREWVGSLHQVGQSIRVSALVLPMNIQGWFLLGLTGLISLLSKGFSRVFSNTTIWKHQFFDTQPLWSNSLILTWLLEKPWLWLDGCLLAKWYLCFLIPL